jgi:hypothetical protein
MQRVGPQLINIISTARVGTHNDREVKGIHEKEILIWGISYQIAGTRRKDKNIRNLHINFFHKKLKSICMLVSTVLFFKEVYGVRFIRSIYNI